MIIKPKKAWITPALVTVLLALYSCAPGPVKVSQPVPSLRRRAVRLGYTVQVGAFSRLHNAAVLTHRLQRANLWAFYFKDVHGLYKVRFGNFSSRCSALTTARSLRRRGIITNFYIVTPTPLSRLLSTQKGIERLRSRLVRTAYSFIGLPYRWGGTSPGKGFDCSGLTMAVYWLNGLVLPRSSYQQWKAGTPVQLKDIKKGDLVFFATSGWHRVSHVGIYVGNNGFIHAPGKGKRIKMGSLNNPYFRRHFVGARKYV